MDRLDEESVETDIVYRNPDAIQQLVDNYGKGFSKFLNEVIKFHERESNQETENTRNIAKVYGTLRISLHNHHRMPLKSYFESAGTELSQWIFGLDERRSAAAQQALEDLKRHRAQYTVKCKSLKEQWKSMKSKCLEARETHKTAKSSYQRLGREYEKLLQVCGEESNSFGSTDLLDSIASGDGADYPKSGTIGLPASSKRERQRMQLERLESKFNEAENEYKDAVHLLRSRIRERTQCHVELLASLKQAAMDADSALLRTEEKLLSLAREHAESVLSKVDLRESQIKDYKPGGCYQDWTKDNLSLSPVVEDDVNIVFIPFTSMSSCRDSSTYFHTSPPVVPRLHDNRPGSPAVLDLHFNNRRSTDLQLDSKRRDSVDGSSDGSTPGSQRKVINYRSSEEIVQVRRQKTPELTPTEEETRGKGSLTSQTQRTSWFQKTIMRWVTTGGGRTGSLGSASGGSPPLLRSSPSVDEEMRAIRQIVQKCVVALDKTGLSTEGLYRKGGSEAKTRDIINDMFGNPDGVSLDELPPLVLCAVVKKCFIKMRDPLFTEALHSDFVRIGMNPDANDALEELKKIINSLPPLNFEIASIFIHHLYRVAEVEENQMSSENLGTCLAPTLLHQKNLSNIPQSMKHSKEILANLEVKECNRVLSMIIDNVDYLFGKSETDNSSRDSDPTIAAWNSTLRPGSVQAVDLQVDKIEPSDTERVEVSFKHHLLTHTESAPIPSYPASQAYSGPTSASSTSAGLSKSSVADSVWSSGSSSGVGQCSWVSGNQPTRSEDSPPPVPPALGRRKHSSEKNPVRKMHEVRLRSQYSSANTRSCNSDVFDDRILLADVYSGSARPNAFQMIDSSGFSNLFRRMKSVEYSDDLDKSFSHGYSPTPNGLRSSPHLHTFTPSLPQSVSVRNSIQSPTPSDTQKYSASLPRPQKVEGRVFVGNGRTRRRGSVGDINGLYRGLGPPPTPPPKPPHLRCSPSPDSSTSTSRKSSREAAEVCDVDKSLARNKLLARRQSEPIGLTGFGEIFSIEDVEARRQRRASTVPGASFEALPSNRLFVPRRSQPEFV